MTSPQNSLHARHFTCIIFQILVGEGFGRVVGDSAQSWPAQTQPKCRGNLECGLPALSPWALPVPWPTTPTYYTQEHPALPSSGWMHSGPTLVNNWLCDLGQGTSSPAICPSLAALIRLWLCESVSQGCLPPPLMLPGLLWSLPSCHTHTHTHFAPSQSGAAERNTGYRV